MNTVLEHHTPAPLAVEDRPPLNTLAALALALSFVTVIGGIIAGHAALAQIRRTGERGRGLAIAALAIGYTIVGFFAALVIGLPVAAAIVAAFQH